MHKSIVKIDTQQPTVAVNFDQAKAEIERMVSKYRGIVVTADTLKEGRTSAQELNALAKEIDSRRKAAVSEVSAPIKAFEEQMKELRQIVLDGRSEITDQMDKFEQERLEDCKRKLDTLCSALIGQYEVAPEFQRARYDDLVKLGSLTDRGNLTGAAKNELEKRVQADRQLQDQVKMRLLELENASYKAGLDAPLERQHIEHFLFEDDETYQAKLQALLDTEVKRQEQTRLRARERAERDAQQQEVARKVSEEREARLAEQNPREGADGHATAKEASGPATFELTVPARIADEAIAAECRRKMTEDAGFQNLTEVTVLREKEDWPFVMPVSAAGGA